MMNQDKIKEAYEELSTLQEMIENHGEIKGQEKEGLGGLLHDIFVDNKAARSKYKQTIKFLLKNEPEEKHPYLYYLLASFVYDPFLSKSISIYKKQKSILFKGLGVKTKIDDETLFLIYKKLAVATSYSYDKAKSFEEHNAIDDEIYKYLDNALQHKEDPEVLRGIARHFIYSQDPDTIQYVYQLLTRCSEIEEDHRASDYLTMCDLNEGMITSAANLQEIAISLINCGDPEKESAAIRVLDRISDWRSDEDFIFNLYLWADSNEVWFGNRGDEVYLALFHAYTHGFGVDINYEKAFKSLTYTNSPMIQAMNAACYEYNLGINATGGTYLRILENRLSECEIEDRDYWNVLIAKCITEEKDNDFRSFKVNYRSDGAEVIDVANYERAHILLEEACENGYSNALETKARYLIWGNRTYNKDSKQALSILNKLLSSEYFYEDENYRIYLKYLQIWAEGDGEFNDKTARKLRELVDEHGYITAANDLYLYGREQYLSIEELVKIAGDDYLANRLIAEYYESKEEYSLAEKHYFFAIQEAYFTHAMGYLYYKYAFCKFMSGNYTYEELQKLISTSEVFGTWYKPVIAEAAFCNKDKSNRIYESRSKSRNEKQFLKEIEGYLDYRSFSLPAYKRYQIYAEGSKYDLHEHEKRLFGMYFNSKTDKDLLNTINTDIHINLFSKKILRKVSDKLVHYLRDNSKEILNSYGDNKYITSFYSKDSNGNVILAKKMEQIKDSDFLKYLYEEVITEDGKSRYRIHEVIHHFLDTEVFSDDAFEYHRYTEINSYMLCLRHFLYSEEIDERNNAAHASETISEKKCAQTLYKMFIEPGVIYDFLTKI